MSTRQPAGPPETTADARPKVQHSFALEGKVAVVTGAAGLLGREHLRALAEAGAYIVGLDRTAEVATVARAIAAENGVESLGLEADICDPDQLRRARDEIVARFGRLDVLVNNAAINDAVEGRRGPPVTFEEYPLSAWRHTLDVNVTGVFLCCQVLGAEMARRGRGSIINIASTYGIVAPNQSLYRDAEGLQTMYKSAAYSTSKGAVLSLTRHLAAYWGSKGVRVNALSPGGVENGQDAGFVKRYSERTPLGRMANPTDYKGAIVFLASEASSYVTGANIVEDGGFTVW
jgi:NAD(P)-dependent dehydrogenase (short-subunit alcohol dehydrogenase family)